MKKTSSALDVFLILRLIYLHHMNLISLFFTLAAIGIAETAYLIGERYANRKPICPIGGGCLHVLESRYNKTFRIYNDQLGLLFYFVMALVAALILLNIGSIAFWNTLITLATTCALLLSGRFFYLQWRVIHAWCFWCLLSALTILLMFFILFLSHFSLMS